MFSKEKLSQAGRKNNKVLAYNLFTKTYFKVGDIKKLDKKIVY